MTDWISVKAQLPETDDEHYLVWLDYKTHSYGIETVGIAMYDGEEWYIWGDALGLPESQKLITHWMPLPEPPEVQND